MAKHLNLLAVYSWFDAQNVLFLMCMSSPYVSAEPSYPPVPAYPAVSSSSGSVSPLVKCAPAPAPMAAMAPAPLPACQPYKPFATATVGVGVPALGESGE